MQAKFALPENPARVPGIWQGEMTVPPVTVQAAPRDLRPDHIRTWDLSVPADHRDAALAKLRDLFANEADMSLSAGVAADSIVVTSPESLEGFVREIASGHLARLNPALP